MRCRATCLRATRSGLIALSLFAAVRAAAAPYMDAAFPLSLAVPDGYKVERKQLSPGVNLFLDDQGSDAFCTVTFIPANPKFDGTQTELNRRAASNLAALVADDGKDHALGPVTPFRLGDAEGVTFEATPNAGQDESAFRFLYVYLEIVAGHAQFVCADAKAAFAGSKPTFERLFRSIRLT